MKGERKGDPIDDSLSNPQLRCDSSFLVFIVCVLHVYEYVYWLWPHLGVTCLH